jgi:nicotinate-nucleotide adenylyltransferase
MEIGLYFGSFNPIHHGHLIIASYARQTTNLQQVWLVVSPQNPLKLSSSLLNEYDRLHLVNIAVQHDPALKVSDIEMKLPKPSYTIATLTALQEKYPAHRFSIIMGSDSFTNLTRWRNYEHIVRNHRIYVFKRHGFDIADDLGAHLEMMQAPLLDISSTTIRSFIKQGISIRYMVPEAVMEEIEKGQYYR